jgi:hypothetical protein
VASISRAASSTIVGAIEAMRPSAMPMSATTPGLPVPS